MIVRGIELAIRDGNEELKRLYQYKEKPTFIKNYAQYHDERLINILKDCNQEKAKEIFGRLYERRLFKMIGELPLKSESTAIKRLLFKMEDKQKEQLEKQVANRLQTDPDYVIVNKLENRNPNYGNQSYDNSIEAIMILEKGQIKSISDYPDELILSRLVHNEIIFTIQVYAPMDSWDDLSKEQRRQKQSKLGDNIREFLLQY